MTYVHMAVFQTNCYDGNDAKFIRCDGSDAYKEAGTVVETYILVDWDHCEMVEMMLVRKYTRGSRWHDYVTRAAFILTNMVIFHAGGK